MKFDRFLLMCIISIVIFSIGAVSASDNVTQGDAIIAENDSSDISTNGTYYDGNLYVGLREDYAYDMNEWYYTPLIYLNSNQESNSQNGTFEIFVNDSEKLRFNLTEGYFSIEDTGFGSSILIYNKFIYPKDLGIENCGIYNIKVKFNETPLINTWVTMKERDDIDVFVMANPYYCEERYLDFSVFMTINSNHFNTGNLEIYVNGARKVNYVIANGSFEYVEDFSNRTRYVKPSTLFDDYGTFNVRIVLIENGTSKELLNETVVFGEFEPTVDPRIEVDLDFDILVLPNDNFACIHLPHEANGTLTVSYNDVKDYQIDYSKGYGEYYIHARQLNHLGNNTLTFTYEGDDFGKLMTNVTCIVQPGITAPSYVSVGEKFKISMITHEWAKGHFNVYGYKDGKKGKLLASNIIDEGYSSVTLSSASAGLNRYYLELDCPGDEYHAIKEVQVVNNSKNVNVTVPSEVNSGEDVVVNVNAPAAPYGFAHISIDGNDYGSYSMETGEVIKAFSGLSKGCHTIYVKYDDGNCSDGLIWGDAYSNTFAVYVGIKTNIIAPNVSTAYNVGKNLVITLKDNKSNVLVGKTIKVKLNGKTYTERTDKNGKVKILVDLPAKTYTAHITYAGDKNHTKSSADAKVVISKAKPKLTAKSKTFKAKAKTKTVAVTLKDNVGRAMKNAKLTLKIKNKKYSAKTNKNGVATFKVKLTKKGSYNAEINFKSNSNYDSASKSIKIKIK